MVEKPSILVGIGKTIKRLMNHPWFVTIAGGIIVTGLFYLLLQRPDILMQIYRVVWDYITIPRIIILACVIVIGSILFILHRDKTQIKEYPVKEEFSPISGLCLGRDTELSQLEKGLTYKNILLIKGIPGIGKTTLGVKFRDILEKKGHRTLWYQCDSESYEGFLIFLSDYLKNRGSLTSQSLKEQSIPPGERLKNAVQELCTYSTVLFLDNFQKVNDSDFRIFRDHLKNSTLIVMSRTEPSFLLESHESLKYLDRDSSVDLLKTLNLKEPQEVLEKIYEKTQGHPWSLVRFADLARVLPVKELLDELPSFGRDQENYLNEECWKYLNESEKDFLMRASVFTKPLTFDALEVCSKTELPEVLTSLAGRFYIIKRGDDYYIHDIIRDFAFSKLKETKELYNEAQRRAADYYGERLSAENLLLIYHHLMEAGDRKGGVDSINENIGYFWREGFWSDVRRVLEESLDFFKDEEMIAALCFNLGTIVYKLGEWDKALEYYEKDLKIFEKLGDVQGMAQTYGNLGLVYDSKGEWDKALEYYEKSLKIKEKLGDVQGMAQTYNNLGLVYHRKGEWDKALEYYEKSLKISEKLGDVQGMASTYGNLGLVYHRKGEWDKALEYYEKSLKISEKLGDVQGMAVTKHNIANILSNKKKFNEALKLYFESESILKKIGDKYNLMNVYHNLAICYRDMNQKEKANECYQKAEELRKQLR